MEEAANGSFFSISFFFFYLFMVTKPGYGDGGIRTDTLFQGQQLRDWELLYSAKGTFRLQFFSPDSSDNRYLGILYSKTILGTTLGSDDPKYDVRAVWVANRDNPVTDASGSLLIDPRDGMLKISAAGLQTDHLVSHVLAESISGCNTSATLLDNGNLVLRQLNSDGSINSTLWQSYDYPTDKLLPGMKLGVNLRTGQNWSLTSWISEQVPASGSFSLSIHPNVSKHLVVKWRESAYWTVELLDDGSFDKVFFPSCFNFSYISDEDEKYFTYSETCDENFRVGLTPTRVGLTLTCEGNIEGAKTFTNDVCPKRLPNGCFRQELPECRKRQGHFWFLKRKVYSSVGQGYTFNQNLNLSLFDCQAECVAKCSCIAFGSISKNGMGCQIWSGLQGIVFSEEGERSLYILGPKQAPRMKWWVWLIIATTLLSLAIFICLIRRRKIQVKGKMKEMVKKVKQAATNTGSTAFTLKLDEKMICQFSLECIAKATNNFSDENKLGEGGFGPVYNGNLLCGQEVAIKRLSKNSGQGLVEFNNEVLLIAKLQHTNLVKLLGICTQEQEKILVYEYMPNKSLDHFLFDSSRQCTLKWIVRMRIIEGIAQGLLYLHKYSRLKVIHRDLKASNVLLDHSMHPKISDFGLARLFEAQESMANTKRIVGTRGYISPEYMISGVISLKTDVFSFGVLLLEIVSGKKNLDSYDADRPLNLFGLAWELWTEDRAMELVDSSMDDHLDYKSELMKCINVGLLCVQDCPNDRPSMTDIVSLLTSESVQLPTPKRPAFFIETRVREIDDRVALLRRQSRNDMSISLMEAR